MFVNLCQEQQAKYYDSQEFIPQLIRFSSEMLHNLDPDFPAGHSDIGCLTHEKNFSLIKIEIPFEFLNVLKQKLNHTNIDIFFNTFFCSVNDGEAIYKILSSQSISIVSTLHF